MKIDKLIQEIESRRKEMTRLGIDKGLTNIETVRSSQELDKLLNRLQYSQNRSFSKVIEAKAAHQKR